MGVWLGIFDTGCPQSRALVPTEILNARIDLTKSQPGLTAFQTEERLELLDQSFYDCDFRSAVYLGAWFIVQGMSFDAGIWLLLSS